MAYHRPSAVFGSETNWSKARLIGACARVVKMVKGLVGGKSLAYLEAYFKARYHYRRVHSAETRGSCLEFA